MLPSDKWLKIAKEIVDGLAVKPGVHFADKKIVTQLVAQNLAGLEKRHKITLVTTP